MDTDVAFAQPAVQNPRTISLPENFAIRAVDTRLNVTQPSASQAKDLQTSQIPKTPQTPAATPDLRSPPVILGPVLEKFKGKFVGTGFNTIFRPQNTASQPASDSDNLLELNVTKEELQFLPFPESTPNRGSGEQPDTFLNGVSYTQVVQDVTNPRTGKADATPLGIHFENGLFMRTPALNKNPKIGATLSRMASIPHGTTINAQCLEPSPQPVVGAPSFPEVSITPFDIRSPDHTLRFDSQTITNSQSARKPQHLRIFSDTKTITQQMLDNPNTVLKKANEGKNITGHISFTVSTKFDPETGSLGGGTTNVAFLVGTTIAGQRSPNAEAISMTCTYWISTVKYTIEIPPWKLGEPSPVVTPIGLPPGAAAPTFNVDLKRNVTRRSRVEVLTTQIQYSQNIILNFSGLGWPHVSVATLLPQSWVINDSDLPPTVS
ncbi:MAG: hypothetical protein Q9165_003801 [Trypethelium subeluteriae]